MKDAEFTRLIYSQRDFQLSLSALDFFSELDEGGRFSKVELRRFRCYQDMAVISYCRPFTSSPGLPLFSLKKIGIRPNKDQAALHSRVQTYRNKIVAHSDADLMRIGFHVFGVGDEHRQINMPHVIFDEALGLVDMRAEWMEWLHIIIHGIVKSTFDFAQSVPDGFKFIKDYLEQDG
jgi:hypothetical protein